MIGEKFNNPISCFFDSPGKRQIAVSSQRLFKNEKRQAKSSPYPDWNPARQQSFHQGIRMTALDCLTY